MNKTLGFCRVGAAIPTVWPGAVSDNVASLADLAKRAAEAATDVLVFPELCVTGYTCADLFYQPALLSAAREGLTRFLKKTWQLDTLFLLGMPVEHGGALFNCAVALHRGRLLAQVDAVGLVVGRRSRSRCRWAWCSGATCLCWCPPSAP